MGRIIGKGGQNVREMQRTTSSVIKLPEQGASTGDETTVHIIGNFFAAQSAQRRIRAMLNQQSAQTPSSGPLPAAHSGASGASGASAAAPRPVRTSPSGVPSQVHSANCSFRTC